MHANCACAEDCGQQFVGFARRTADEERPHQFTFELTDDGSVAMNYKRFSFDKEVWNKKPLQLLSEAPRGAPRMQAPQRRHLERVAELRPGVFANFRINTVGGECFTAEDIKWYTDFFNTFSAADGQFAGTEALAAQMEQKLGDFAGLWPMPNDVSNVIQLAQAEQLVEPILHSNQTAAEQKEIRAVYKAKQSEKPKLCRGSRAISLAAQRVLERLEKEADERLGRARQHDHNHSMKFDHEAD